MKQETKRNLEMIVLVIDCLLFFYTALFILFSILSDYQTNSNYGILGGFFIYHLSWEKFILFKYAKGISIKHEDSK